MGDARPIPLCSADRSEDGNDSLRFGFLSFVKFRLVWNQYGEIFRLPVKAIIQPRNFSYTESRVLRDLNRDEG
jgi:hypothetical protein